MDFPPFWVGIGGKTVKGKPLLLKHTKHLYSDSLWQRVRLTLHPVSPHTAPPALQQMSCPGSEPTEVLTLRLARGGRSQPGTLRRKSLKHSVERATAALEQGRLLTANTNTRTSTAGPEAKPRAQVLLSQQGLSSSHPHVPALLLQAWAPLGRAKQGCPLKHLVRAACSCSSLLWCVGSESSAPSPSPRWHTQGLPTALTEPSCTCSEESFASSSAGLGRAAAPGSVRGCPVGTEGLCPPCSSPCF